MFSGAGGKGGGGVVHTHFFYSGGRGIERGIQRVWSENGSRKSTILKPVTRILRQFIPNDLKI